MQVAIWWSASTAFSISSKRFLHESDAKDTGDTHSHLILAVFLTWAQSLVACIASLALLGAHVGISEAAKSVSSLSSSDIVLGSLHGAGNLATNALLVFGSVSAMSAFKSGEVLFVVVALRCILPNVYEREVSVAALFWLLVIVAGVLVTLLHRDRNSSEVDSLIASAAAAFICNSLFALRTVLIKKFKYSGRAAEAEIDGRQGQVREEAGVPDFAKRLYAFTQVSLVALAACTAVLFNSLLVTAYKPTAWASGTKPPYALFSGLAYFLYNLVSFHVLGGVSSSAHSVLKAGKRLAVLLGAAVVLHEHMAPVEWLGMLAATGGIVCFTRASTTAKIALEATTQEVASKSVSDEELEELRPIG